MLLALTLPIGIAMAIAGTLLPIAVKQRFAHRPAFASGIGVTGINFLLNAVEVVPQEQVLASMRLFAREVMPRFQER